MKDNNKKQLQSQQSDRGLLWAVLFTIAAFVGMAIFSNFFN